MCAEYHLLITNKMVELRSNNLIQMFHYIVMLTHCGCSYATATTSAHKHCTKLKETLTIYKRSIGKQPRGCATIWYISTSTPRQRSQSG